jgi:hypothetical protein
MTTIADVATHDYARRAAQLQLMARDFEALGDTDQAREARMGALIVFGAGRAEARNPASPPVQCPVCLGSKFCDPDVHMRRDP